MNQTPDLAAKLAADPPPELQQLLNDPRTTDSAREAVADVVKPSTTATSVGASVNGHTSTSSPGALPDGRLQIVDEKQNFTWVQQAHH